MNGEVCDTISIANFEGAYAMVRHLLRLGHRRIAMICGPERNVDAEERFRGFRAALSEAGIEPDPAVAQWIAEHCQGMGCAVGLFPDIVNTLPRCDVFLAMDVLEHVPDQTAFAAGVWEVLKPGGVAIIQTPMHEGVLWPPFHPRTLDAFESIEHLWIHTRASAAELFARAGLEIVNNAERWVNMHEIIILRRAT
jgi:SAM-dependent methyltransferase